MSRICLPLLVLDAALAGAIAPRATAATPTDPASTPAAIAAIAESTSAILRGDSQQAAQVLAASPVEGFLGKDATYRACMLQRHRAAAPVFATEGIDDPFVRGVLQDYQDYWWHALRTPSQRAALESQLLARLRTRIGGPARDAKDMDAIEPLVQAALLERGHHAQLGRTPPLRELMVWRKQDTRMFDVQL